MSKFSHQLGITIGDKSVELNVDGSLFKLSLDDRGVPQFPESVKQQLPPYMPKAVEEIISVMSNCRQNETYNLNVVHQYWCAEPAGIGMCNCDPVLCPSEMLGLWQWYEGSWGTLTCVVCHTSSNGRTGSDHVRYNGDRLFEKHCIYNDNEEDNDLRVYWAFSNTALICEECLRNIMSKTGMGFPNKVDCAFSSDRGRKPVLH